MYVKCSAQWLHLDDIDKYGDDRDDGDDDNGEEEELVLTARKHVENQQVLYKSHACVMKSE